MKRLILVSILFSTYFLYSQTASYNDIGVLFTKENINGTARFNAMSGAFGALGGDLSAIDVNPAGAAIFLNSEASFSIDYGNNITKTSFYNVESKFEKNLGNFSQIGCVFVFENNTNNSSFENVAISFNYTKTNNFENFWSINGNSSYAPISDIHDENSNYPFFEKQYLDFYSNGQKNKYSFSIASQYEKNLYLGFSFNAYDLDFSNSSIIEELNNDGNENTFDVQRHQYLLTYGTGISLGFGLIYKSISNLRLGLAYQSPIWHNLTEEFSEYDVPIIIENEINSYYDYILRTPSKLTGSFAYIFGKTGLISADLSRKNYKNIRLSNGDFSSENSEFDNFNQAIYELRLGTEWRFDKLSLRGGYHYEQSPYKDAFTTNNIEGYSLGAGYNFGNLKIDFSYQQDLFTSQNRFYSSDIHLQYSDIDYVELDTKLEKFTVSLVVKL